MSLPPLAHELGTALRGWARAPGVALTAVLTLALGIGASTAVFSVVYAVLIQPLPYRDAARLVVVRAEQDFEGAARPVRALFQSDAIAAWPRDQRAFSSMAFYADSVGALNQPTGSELVNTAIVEGPFFATVDGPVLLGRGLAPSDLEAPVAVISERLWRRHFAGAASVLGQTVTLSGQVLTIVGVAGDGFQVPLRGVDVWMTAGAARSGNPRCCGFTPIGRLAPGASIDAAGEEVAATTRALAERMPRQLANTRAQVIALGETVVANVRPALLVLAGAVGLLLALAAGNVAGLLLARQTARRHEVAIRRALGASSWRLAREGIAESAWIGAGGAVAGALLAWAGVRLLHALAPDALPRVGAAAIDGRALAFAAAAAAAVTVVAGLVPLLSSAGLTARLRTEERGSTASRRARSSLRAITVAQFAISVLLLAGAALFGRSLVALLRTDLGVVPEHVATASINLAMGRTLTDAEQAVLAARIVDRVAALPGVQSAGVGTSRPPDLSRVRLTLARNTDAGQRASYQAAWVPATPGYFAALGIRLEHGRLFTDADRAAAPPVVILSASTARRLFPNQEAVGQRIGLPALRDGKNTSIDMTIVGVVADVKFSGLDQPADDVVYRPFAQQPWVSAFLIVRTLADPGVLATQLAREVAAVDRAVAVSDTRSMDAVLSSVTTEPRLRSLVLAAIAVFAILIAGVGLHGVIAYSVSQRRAELGVRMALGADGSRIRAMVVREGVQLALAGGIAGLAGALAAGRFLSALLYGIGGTDATSLALAVAGAVVAGAAGSYVPARRASKTDPASVLRAE